MAFMKTSVPKKVTVINERTLLEGLSDEQIKDILNSYLQGKNIGFIPSPELLRKHGL